MVTGEENYLHRTLASVGVPPLHILRAHNGEEYRFYELSGDLPEALHYRHFESTSARRRARARPGPSYRRSLARRRQTEAQPAAA